MATTGSFTEIYTDNRTARAALKGLTERVGRYLKKNGIPLSPKILQRQAAEYRAEIGAGFLNRTAVLLKALVEIGEPQRAQMILDDFQAICAEEREPLDRTVWQARVFRQIGELQALIVSDDWDEVERKRYELAEILTANIQKKMCVKIGDLEEVKPTRVMRCLDFITKLFEAVGFAFRTKNKNLWKSR